jgi:carbohydrate-selective porin OprB
MPPGIGFAWSRSKDDAPSLYHTNEYVLEAGYALQLTPTAKLQPDIQVVWNPAYNPSAGPATVFQLQLEFAW